MKETTTIWRAQRILGFKHVITAEQMQKAWGFAIPEFNETVYYDQERDIIESAENNDISYSSAWRLYFYSGMSIAQQMQRRPDSFSNPNLGSFWENTKTKSAGFYLINFFKEFPGLTWEEQKEEIACECEDVIRTDVSILTEAVISFNVIHHINLLRGWRHWNIVKSNKKPGTYFYSGICNKPKPHSSKSLIKISISNRHPLGLESSMAVSLMRLPRKNLI